MDDANVEPGLPYGFDKYGFDYKVFMQAREDVRLAYDADAEAQRVARERYSAVCKKYNITHDEKFEPIMRYIEQCMIRDWVRCIEKIVYKTATASPDSGRVSVGRMSVPELTHFIKLEGIHIFPYGENEHKCVIERLESIQGRLAEKNIRLRFAGGFTGGFVTLERIERVKTWRDRVGIGAKPDVQ